jgi:hypothetical protein
MYAEVMDSIDLNGRVAVEYGDQGVIAVFGLPPRVVEPSVGRAIIIVRPDGWMLRSIVREVKEHGPDGRSVFLRNLTRSDVPIGSRLYWGEAIRELIEEATTTVEIGAAG